MNESIELMAEAIENGLTSVSKSIHANFTSPNVSDSNWEPANVVDAIAKVAYAINRLAEAVEALGPKP